VVKPRRSRDFAVWAPGIEKAKKLTRGRGGTIDMNHWTTRLFSSTPRLLASALMAVSSALLLTVFVFEDLSALLNTAWSDVP
jgi:hypothetical protein